MHTSEIRIRDFSFMRIARPQPHLLGLLEKQEIALFRINQTPPFWEQTTQTDPLH